MAIEQTPIPPEELELFRQFRDLRVILDVGARIDIDYIELWPESEHHLFEPNPQFAEELRRKLKEKPNVYINEFGLGDKNMEAGYQFGLQAFIDSKSINNPEARKDIILPIKTLDTYVREKEIKRIDFLKIDTEGYDLKVLLGAMPWFYIIRFIQYEHWGDADNRMIKGLLTPEFECYDVGYRNVLCMNKTLVNDEERERLVSYIGDNKLAELT